MSKKGFKPKCPWSRSNTDHYAGSNPKFLHMLYTAPITFFLLRLPNTLTLDTFPQIMEPTHIKKGALVSNMLIWSASLHCQYWSALKNDNGRHDGLRKWYGCNKGEAATEYITQERFLCCCSVWLTLSRPTPTSRRFNRALSCCKVSLSFSPYRRKRSWTKEAAVMGGCDKTSELAHTQEAKVSRQSWRRHPWGPMFQNITKIL